MQLQRCYVTVAVLDGLIYVGGYDGFGQLNSVEFYNPKFDQWTTVTPMFERRCNFGIEVVQKINFPFLSVTVTH
uniref:Uncharacterized protein n=1 Tax=Astyanax mexicanus TaxID=7994 RepID=A0A8B9KSS7_ASTMX